MKADAIKLVAAAALSGIEPTEQEQTAALGEAVDIALGFFANVERMTVALSTLAECVTDNCQPSFSVNALVDKTVAE